MHGFRLAEIGVSFSWRDLGVLIRRWGGLPGTATYRSVHGFEGWSTEAQLLANVIEALESVDFNQLRIAKAKPKKPSPVKRPWDDGQGASIGSGAVPFDEIDEWMRSTWTA